MRQFNLIHVGALALLQFVGVGSTFASWSIESRGSLVLNTSGVAGVEGLSGAAYIGNQSDSARFYAAQDNGDQIVELSVTVSADGALITAVADAAFALSPATLDTEGIAIGVSNATSVFLSEETTPGVREFDLATGQELQSVALPAVFANARVNFGLESLTRHATSNTMWTANEEALTIDGPRATDADGTIVRLLQLDINGQTISAGAQFAYPVDPVHDNHVPADGSRSGLVDLVVLPDLTVVALERSLGFSSGLGIPTFESRIYAIDFAGATDISAAAFDGGLEGQVYTTVSKELIWSGRVGGVLGENLEGLALGPPTQNGFLLVGVVDSGDPVSQNTIATFELLASSPDAPGDFDKDGDVDGDDFLAWQGGFGTTTGATISDGDADADGDVDGDDFLIWQSNFGATSGGLAAVAIPESNALLEGALCLFCAAVWSHFRGGIKESSSPIGGL